MIQTANIRTSHDSNSSYQGCHMIQTAKNTGHMIQTARNGVFIRVVYTRALSIENNSIVVIYHRINSRYTPTSFSYTPTSLLQEVYMEFIHLLLSNLIGQNVQAMVQLAITSCTCTARSQH